MTTETITLSSFLLARIAEDEETAQAALSVGDPSWRATLINPQTGEAVLGAFVVSDIPFAQLAITETGYPPHAVHIARQDPARALAECGAKRAIVESAEFLRETPSIHRDTIVYMDAVLAKLAAVYSAHPDYDPAWA